MANFLGLFKTITKDAGLVAQYGSFGISVFNPALGAIVSKIGTAIVVAEAQIPDSVPNAGATKSQVVTSDFAASMQLTQSLLEATGKTMTWDAGKLQNVIDAQTKALNLFHDLAASIKIADTVPATKAVSTAPTSVVA